MNQIPWLKIFTQSFERPSQLPGLLSEYGLSTKQLISLGSADVLNNEPYSRKILFKSNDIEVMLAHWNPGSIAAPHNHGHSKGLIWFTEGRFSEKHFIFSKNELSEKKQIEFFNSNEVVKVASSDIHSCQSIDQGVSLHIYSPPITKMKVWDYSSRRTLTVADQCGAWVPADENLIVESKLWDHEDAQSF